VEPFRVLIADDHPITRSGLKSLLAEQPDIEVIGEATDGAEAIEMATALQPDCVLMDVKMPEINGIDATRAIHRSSPHIAILVLTVFDDDALVFPAIRAGARGYLLKDANQEELTRAIATVVSGGAVFSPGIAHKVLAYLHAAPAGAPPDLLDELTVREREVMTLIAQGLTNTEIAAQLALSPKTVSNYISNVLLKLHATDRAKLLLMALDAGLGANPARGSG
jgi:DNA-binding NarL/FixJ family response regulator